MKEIIPAIDQAWAVRCVINGRLRDINKGLYTGEGSMLFLRRLEAAYDTLMHIANTKQAQITADRLAKVPDLKTFRKNMKFMKRRHKSVQFMHRAHGMLQDNGQTDSSSAQEDRTEELRS